MRSFLTAIVVLASCSAAVAGPLARCIKAVSSANGNFLVITEPSQELQVTPEISGAKRFKKSSNERVTLRVVEKGRFDTDTSHRVILPNTYWVGSVRSWSVQLKRGDEHMSSCPISLLSDDGEFLILLGEHFSEYVPDSVLRIYRRPQSVEQQGILVKDIGLKELWPADRVRGFSQVVSDGSDHWYNDGTFDFSKDSCVLTYKTPWGKTVPIRLSDCSVSP